MSACGRAFEFLYVYQRLKNVIFLQKPEAGEVYIMKGV